MGLDTSRPSSRVKMADIARLAGVSVSTVSRALADSPLVPASTRIDILRLAGEHGYVIDQGARRLRLRRTDTIAIVIPLGHESGQPISDPFFLELVGHLADEITSRGYDVLLTRVPSPNHGWLERLIHSGRSDGIIVIGQSDQHAALNVAALDYLTLVVWGARMPGQNYCTVGVDNVEGGRLAATHLIGLGRRHVAFLGSSDVPEITQRRRGYEAALHDAGLPLDPNLVVATHLLGASVAEPLETLLATGTPLDAMVCATDVIALAAMRLLQDRGWRIPDDVAVVGFDDVAMAAQANPPLTTIRQDLTAGAKAVVAALVERLAGVRAHGATLATELVVRASA